MDKDLFNELESNLKKARSKVKRVDVVDGVSYGDWYSQQLKEYGYETDKQYYNGHEEATTVATDTKQGDIPK